LRRPVFPKHARAQRVSLVHRDRCALRNHRHTSIRDCPGNGIMLST
jgi:hypothetical protein